MAEDRFVPCVHEGRSDPDTGRTLSGAGLETEYEIYRHSAELTRGKTTILISHRFTTVRMADRMVVMDKGRIIEDGTHEALMALKGKYAEMFTTQAARYTDTRIT